MLNQVAQQWYVRGYDRPCRTCLSHSSVVSPQAEPSYVPRKLEVDRTTNVTTHVLRIAYLLELIWIDLLREYADDIAFGETERQAARVDPCAIAIAPVPRVL